MKALLFILLASGCLDYGKSPGSDASMDMRGLDSSAGIDLAAIDLRGVDLSGVDLSGVDLAPMVPQYGTSSGACTFGLNSAFGCVGWTAVYEHDVNMLTVALPLPTAAPYVVLAVGWSPAGVSAFPSEYTNGGKTADGTFSWASSTYREDDVASLAVTFDGSADAYVFAIVVSSATSVTSLGESDITSSDAPTSVSSGNQAQLNLPLIAVAPDMPVPAWASSLDMFAKVAPVPGPGIGVVAYALSTAATSQSTSFPLPSAQATQDVAAFPLHQVLFTVK